MEYYTGVKQCNTTLSINMDELEKLWFVFFKQVRYDYI